MQTSSLRGQLLVAMPKLNDPMFSGSIVYIIEHDDSGAKGFIINKPVDLQMEDILSQIDIKLKTKDNRPMLLGGPVSPDQLFMVLPEELENKLQSHSELKQLSTKETLEVLIDESENFKKTLLFLGQSGWVSGQLESELQDNSWLVMPSNLELLYDVPYERRYQTAAALMGFDFKNLSDEIGHA